MSAYIAQASPVEQAYPVFKDSASTSYGDGSDKCGVRQYTISLSPVPNPSTPIPFTLDSANMKLVLASSINTQAAIYTATFTVTVPGYPQIAAHIETFTVTLNKCQITSVTADATLDGTTVPYNVGQGTLNIPYVDFTFAPVACDVHTFTYLATLNNGGT